MEQQHSIHRIPPWGIWDGIVILAAAALFTNFFALAISPIVRPWEPVWRFVMISVMQTGLIILGLFLLVAFRYRVSLKTLGLEPVLLRQGLSHGWRWGLVIFALVTVTSMAMQALFSREPGPQPFAQMVLSAHGLPQLTATVLMGVVLAPLGEELLFRGFLYPALRGRFGMVWATVVSATIFGALHLDLLRLVPLAVGGAGLAWLYERSGTLYAPITAHAIWNAVMLSLLLLTGVGTT